MCSDVGPILSEIAQAPTVVSINDNDKLSDMEQRLQLLLQKCADGKLLDTPLSSVSVPVDSSATATATATATTANVNTVQASALPFNPYRHFSVVLPTYMVTDDTNMIADRCSLSTTGIEFHCIVLH